jgi:hypothetical protein
MIAAREYYKMLEEDRLGLLKLELEAEELGCRESQKDLQLSRAKLELEKRVLELEQEEQLEHRLIKQLRDK